MNSEPKIIVDEYDEERNERLVEIEYEGDVYQLDDHYWYIERDVGWSSINRCDVPQEVRRVV